MYELTEKKVKNILQNKNQILKNIRDKRVQLYEMMEDTESALISSALPTAGAGFLPSGKGNHRDVGDILLDYRKELRRRNKELREVLLQLSEMEEGVYRAWTCFCALSDPYYGILKSLYVENQLYQTVEKDFDHSHKTFERYRKSAIQTLMQYYDSSMSVSQLLEMHNQNKSSLKLSGKGKCSEIPGQLSLSHISNEEDLPC